MTIVTLTTGLSYRRGSLAFARGVADDVSPEVAETLRKTGRFAVEGDAAAPAKEPVPTPEAPQDPPPAPANTEEAVKQEEAGKAAKLAAAKAAAKVAAEPKVAV